MKIKNTNKKFLDVCAAPGGKAFQILSKKNDIVAILGKGREKYQDIQGEKVYHSDLDILKFSNIFEH